MDARLTTIEAVAPKEWPGEIILPDNPNSYDNMMGKYDDRNPLPNDGLPRMTSEGIEILAEGLRGDFHRWRWGIGNHPLEMPVEHIRNLTIHCMKDEPHFMAAFWFGEYPIVNYRACTPWIPFDTLDRMHTQYHEGPTTNIQLRSSADYWFYIPVQIDSNYLWDEKARAKWARRAECEDEPDEDEPEDPCEPEGPRNATLDAWMGAD